MANRSYYQNRYSNVPEPVRLTAAVAFNGSGTPTLLTYAPTTGYYTAAPAAGTTHFVSFTRSATGVYVLTLVDKFVRLLGANVTFISNTDAAAPIWQVTVASDPTNGQAFGTSVGDGTVRTGTPSVKFTFYSAQGTAADPAATEMATIALELQNSTAT